MIESTINLDHLEWPDTGWGYLPPSDSVFKMLKDINTIYNPQNVLEIGYHMGHSTTYMLECFPQASVMSIAPEKDVKIKDDGWISTERRLAMAKKMAEVYDDRWTWLKGRTGQVFDPLVDGYTGKFDLALVDGQHAYKFAKKDINLCKALQVPVILVDNIDRKDVLKAVEDAGGYKLIQSYSYTDNWKGKPTPTEIGLYYLL